ncbi:basic region leucine zipper [Dictyocaulus viviparus]|uniref:Basic region leucine zipper n=1 Tax=Dictyocaulus viviparus TaxID=29172 RepID=A0A0D8XEQ3_DICVI|nr:basic region leucine zipper [Dictyocaulus viviparus]
MDVDSSSSSPSERLSVVCSASTEYSSNSEYSPNSRRNSVNESIVKDEPCWDRRRKNNDALKRSREKRRVGDMAMEQRILALSQENHLLKSRLESRTAAESFLQTSRPDLASLPPQSNTPLFTHLPTSSMSLSSLTVPPLSSIHSAVPNLSLAQVPLLSSTSQLPLMQLCQLQAAIQHQYRATPPSSSVFSVGSAFQPFHAQKDTVIMKAERISPDSSSDRVERVIQRVPSPQNKQERVASQSLLGALLATRRTSPAVPQSRTEHHSRLGSPPKFSPFKSDCESISSSASLSPHSSEDHPETSAIRRALEGNSSNDKKEQYMDRRRRNNEAAKRCRANRRALLENENDQLKEQIAKLKQEVDQFKSLITAQNIMETQ